MAGWLCSEWEDKVSTAFFRGTATGGGTRIENNQRLKLANLHYVWCAARRRTRYCLSGPAIC